MIKPILKPKHIREAQGQVLHFTERQKSEQLDRKIEEQDGKCYYCFRVMNRIMYDMGCATRDHKKSKGMGGSNIDESDNNIVAACFKCNADKGSQGYEAFYRRRHPAE